VLQRLSEKSPRLVRGEGPLKASHVELGWFEVVDELCAYFDALVPDEPAEGFELLQIKERLKRDSLALSISAGAPPAHQLRRRVTYGGSSREGEISLRQPCSHQ